MNLPKMYAITCHQLAARRDLAIERFAAAGLEVELFDGIHGPTAAIKPGLAHFDSPQHYITSGKVALTLSKMFLWTVCCERPEDEVLIFEDDVVFVPHFREEFARSYAALPLDWDVVHVGHCCTEDKKTLLVNERVREIREPLCCHAVLWKKSALRFALAQLRKASFSTHSDILAAHLVYPHLRHYSFVPPLVLQDQSPSAALSNTDWKGIAGWFDEQMRTLYDEALGRVRGPAVFVEIGCWRGRSAAYMGTEIKRRLKPVTFYAVDTWKGTEGHEHQGEVKKLGGDMFPTFWQNMIHCGVTDHIHPLQKPSVAAAQAFADNSCDFVFVDGDHSYEGCLADIRAWRPKLKTAGVMAGHDVDREGVRRAVEKEFRGKWRQWERCWIVDHPAGQSTAQK